MVLRNMELGFTREQATFTLSLVACIGLVGSFFVGYMDERLGTKKSMVFFGIWYALSLLANATENTILVYVSIFMIGMSIGGSANFTTSLVTSVYGRQGFSKVNSVIFPIQGAVSALSFVVNGVVSNITGGNLRYTYIIFAGVSIVSSLCWSSTSTASTGTGSRARALPVPDPSYSPHLVRTDGPFPQKGPPKAVAPAAGRFLSYGLKDNSALSRRWSSSRLSGVMRHSRTPGRERTRFRKGVFAGLTAARTRLLRHISSTTACWKRGASSSSTPSSSSTVTPPVGMASSHTAARWKASGKARRGCPGSRRPTRFSSPYRGGCPIGWM